MNDRMRDCGVDDYGGRLVGWWKVSTAVAFVSHLLALALRLRLSEQIIMKNDLHGYNIFKQMYVAVCT